MVPSEEEEVAEGYAFEPPHPFVKALVGDPEHHLAYDVRAPHFYPSPRVLTVPLQLWKLHDEKRALRKSHLDHWARTARETGTGRPVDAIISPAVAYTAVPHGLNTCVFLIISTLLILLIVF